MLKTIMNHVKYKQRLVNINIKVVMEKSMYAFQQIVNNILINSLLPTDKCALQLAGFDNYDLRFPNDRKLQDDDNNSNDLFSKFGRMLFAAPKSEISKSKKGINKSRNGVNLEPKHKNILRHTLNLPKTKLPMKANAAKREPYMVNRTTTNLYKWQQQVNKNNKDNYVLHDGPPYANGSLHMGHLLNKTLKDIGNRFQLLNGKRVDYIPGWDCHGLPIELKALQALNQDETEELTPEKIRKLAQKVALEAIEGQRGDFERWGVMADWQNVKDNNYITMDKEYEFAQLEILKTMILNGIVYRGLKPVYWSPSSQTALAEAELEYKDHLSQSVYVKFQFKSFGNGNLNDLFVRHNINSQENVYALIWTTTPWTIPSNMALCVHPNVEYSVVRVVNGHGNSNDSYLLIVASDLLNHVDDLRSSPMQNATEDGGCNKHCIERLKSGDFNILFKVHGKDFNDGAACYHPMNKSRTSPFLLGQHVTTDIGTGIVHTAPGHGHDDYLVWKQKQKDQDDVQNIVCPVDDHGKYTEEINTLITCDVDVFNLAGLSVLTDGNLAVIEYLKDKHVLYHQSDYVHRYPHDWRTKGPVITRATKQWFANVGKLHSAASKALHSVKMVPPVSSNRLENMVTGRKEWCISRQRHWGVPIPVFYDTRDSTVLATEESLSHIGNLVRKHGTDCWWTMSIEELLPPSIVNSNSNASTHYIKCTDTLDVWFDSGSSWASVLAQKGLKVPADLYLEGSDQHRGWFQSSLLTSLAVGNYFAPYKNLVTHGFVLDENERKMSKSLGNILEPSMVINGGRSKPKEIVQVDNLTNDKGGGDKKKKQKKIKVKAVNWPAYGVDVLRMWVASTDFTHDVVIGPTNIKKVSEALRKIRNTARFILGNLDSRSIQQNHTHEEINSINVNELSSLDSLMIYRLETFINETSVAYENFNYRKVFDLIQQMISNDLSAFYMDISKDRLYCDHHTNTKRQHCQEVLRYTLNTLLSVVAPIAPFTCEDIYQYYVIDNQHESVGSKEYVDKNTGKGTGVYDVESVFQNIRWPISLKTSTPDWEKRKVEILAGWEVIRLTRDATKRLIESVRKENVVELGDDLEAKVSITIRSSLSEKSKVSNAFSLFNDDLEDIFGTSQITVVVENTNEHKDPTVNSGYFEILNVSDDISITVAVDKADGEKCSRCWKYSVNTNHVDVKNILANKVEDYGDEDCVVPLCPRCKSIVC
jgi:isoleucyl-tRNA synthetase